MKYVYPVSVIVVLLLITTMAQSLHAEEKGTLELATVFEDEVDRAQIIVRNPKRSNFILRVGDSFLNRFTLKHVRKGDDGKWQAFLTDKRAKAGEFFVLVQYKRRKL